MIHSKWLNFDQTELKLTFVSPVISWHTIKCIRVVENINNVVLSTPKILINKTIR